MRRHRGLLLVTILSAALSSAVQDAQGAGGSSRIARVGEHLTPQPHWPFGVAELLNDPYRSEGWESWFSDWPNDVTHFTFALETPDDLNAVLQLFGAIASEELTVRLAPLEEPTHFGWVGRFPAGNNIAAMFSIGNQQQIDQWYAQLRGGKLGLMEFEKAPVAVPPTLTIFVRNKAVDLDRLVIPKHIRVIAGPLPTVWEESNLKPAPLPTTEKVKANEQPVDPEVERAARAIEEFIAAREAAAGDAKSEHE